MDKALTAQEQPEQQYASTISLILQDERFSQLQRLADIMASGKATMPKHLAGNPADCFAVALQAAQWGMNPFAVAQKTHVVNGALGYEAQLVNAVIHASGAVSSRFHYEYEGDGENLQCRVGAVVRGETEVTWGQWLTLKQIKTRNSPLWQTNPKQQLGYLQVKNWARAYCPGAILGVYTPDELADIAPERDITPPRRQSGAEVAAAAREAPPVAEQADIEKRRNLIADLEIVATEQGWDAYAQAWNTLTKQQRNLVGLDEHARLKEIAGRVVEGTVEGKANE